jgi:hypothetical protein
MLAATGNKVPHPCLGTGPPHGETYGFEGTEYRQYRSYADGIAMRHLRHGDETKDWWSHIAGNSPPELATMLRRIAETQGDFPFEQYVISQCNESREDAPKGVLDDFTTFLGYSYSHQRLILNLVLMLHFDATRTQTEHPWLGSTVVVQRATTTEDFIVHVGHTKLTLALRSFIYTGPREVVAAVALPGQGADKECVLG